MSVADNTSLLEARGLTRRFHGLIAVHDVSFTLQRGEILGLIGPNGAGKTTLISLISGTLPPDAGELLFEGRRIEQEPIWDWASRNLSAASERLLSPADRAERAVAPWSAHLILPLFAFSATGVALDVDLSSPAARTILWGVILGLVIGKPLGVSLASLLAIKARIALAPDGVTIRDFIGGACLCGIGDTVALLMADQAFPPGLDSAAAKIGVLAGSVLAAALGAAILASGSTDRAVTPASAP